jgi:hypothetical protein
MPDGTTTAHLYRPTLLTTLREGYSFSALRQDVLSGLTVAVVALPLSMAIAVASGVSPERGLYAAIVGGFIVSALGGQPFPGGRTGRRVHPARRRCNCEIRNRRLVDGGPSLRGDVVAARDIPP